MLQGNIFRIIAHVPFFTTKMITLIYKALLLLCSVSLLMTTTEAAVSELPSTKARIASRMPQMSGMDF